ncbi:Flp pilus assembly protein CpaB [Novosphingobium sp. P6W]|jgi:pilus assembly protein CpaB|uniref:Flp pilus assembly protein CpaB n=1 Tax=Novosphingobium sp. P6W TaxID=1609758 RepID=UPI0005C2CE1A|nr:Flp pilus assembly protein CpaB [Novosphingobium sp. P6W]AXB76207.1 Flp pilus assembly protein CpaB [Novosphingobium sp. P6W]KIS31416.1 pilus assembly protein CpaB [Novosphingobium sp. P6W]
MDRKKVVLLAVALLIAAFTAFAARSMFAGGAAPQAEAVAAQPKGPKVLVAQRALPVGTIITADSVSFQGWPDELVKDAYYIEGEADMSKLLGTVVRFPITAGQPLTQGSLVAPGDRGFLAAALAPGMRAITIPVSAKTGVGGFVFPGDRVDLMLTQDVKGEGSGDSLRTAETILRNLRVLATDQATDSEVVDGKTVVHAFRTVTLEVTPRIAEKVAVAQEIGEISLSLRAIADNQGEFERILANGDVKVPEGATREQEESLMKQAMGKPLEGNTTYVTGGDVSRFQRSTMPTASAPAPVTGAAPQVVSASGQPVRTGPVVRVTRGKETTEEPVGKP